MTIYGSSVCNGSCTPGTCAHNVVNSFSNLVQYESDDAEAMDLSQEHVDDKLQWPLRTDINYMAKCRVRCCPHRMSRV